MPTLTGSKIFNQRGMREGRKGSHPNHLPSFGQTTGRLAPLASFPINHQQSLANQSIHTQPYYASTDFYFTFTLHSLSSINHQHYPTTHNVGIHKTSIHHVGHAHSGWFGCSLHGSFQAFIFRLPPIWRHDPRRKPSYRRYQRRICLVRHGRYTYQFISCRRQGLDFVLRDLPTRP